MSGQADYAAQATLDWMSGRRAMPALTSRFLALFTTAPTSDAGTGGTEASGTGYARVQCAGSLAATASWTTATPNITMTTNPGWIVPGMNVWDLTTTTPSQVGTVSTFTGTALVLTANALVASQGTTDSLQFSAWPASAASSGTEPATTPAQATSGAAVTFAQAGASWGTVTSWALYDALTSGNMICWDYLGNFKWIPFSCTLASPGVITVDLAADAPANGTPCVVTAKYGGTLPTTAGSWAGVLTSAGLSAATFNLAVNTTSTGGGNFRQIVQQAIAANVTASFASGQLIISQA
jgi:hypothetical protein